MITFTKITKIALSVIFIGFFFLLIQEAQAFGACKSSYTIRGYSGNHTICTDWEGNDGCGNLVIDGQHSPPGTSLCSANGDFCPVCSRSAPGVCAYGSSGGVSGGEEINYKQTYNWSCSANGGNRSCNYVIVHGKCNTGTKNDSNVYFDKTSGTFIPSSSPTTMCTSGGLSGGYWSSGTNAGSTYNYSCLGSNGGRNDTGCSWTPEPMAGICGSFFNGRGGITNKISGTSYDAWNYLCSSGPKSAITTQVSSLTGSAVSEIWNCLGTYGGNNASCNISYVPTSGKCNDLFVDGSNSVSVLPATGFLCKKGTVKSTDVAFDSINSVWSWVCKGTGGNPDSGTCSVKKSVDPTVDPTVTTVDAKVTTEKITVSGRITPNIVNKGQFCTLTDLNYEVYPKNADALVLCDVYKGKVDPASVVYDADLSKVGHQVGPGFDYYYSCKDLNSDKVSESVVMKCVLNPIVIER